MPRAHALYEECLALYTSLGNKQGIDEVLFTMAYLAQGGSRLSTSKDFI